MIKVMFSWKDNPDKSPEACEAHYRAVHLEMARRVFRDAVGFKKLVYNRVRGHRVNDFNVPEAHPAVADFDAFIELWFDSSEQLQAAMDNPVLGEMFADHGNFMDVTTAPNIRIYDLEEEVVLSRD